MTQKTFAQTFSTLALLGSIGCGAAPNAKTAADAAANERADALRASAESVETVMRGECYDNDGNLVKNLTAPRLFFRAAASGMTLFAPGPEADMAEGAVCAIGVSDALRIKGRSMTLSKPEADLWFKCAADEKPVKAYELLSVMPADPQDPYGPRKFGYGVNENKMESRPLSADTPAPICVAALTEAEAEKSYRYIKTAMHGECRDADGESLGSVLRPQLLFRASAQGMMIATPDLNGADVVQGPVCDVRLMDALPMAQGFVSVPKNGNVWVQCMNDTAPVKVQDRISVVPADARDLSAGRKLSFGSATGEALEQPVDARVASSVCVTGATKAETVQAHQRMQSMARAASGPK